MSWQTITKEHKLAISVIDFTDLVGRLDAEYYDPYFVTLDKLLSERKDIGLLRELTEKIDVGFVGSMVSEYVDNGVLLLQTRNVKEFFLDVTECQRINEDFHIKLKKSQVSKNDILIARSGSFGNASVYLEDEKTNSADIIIIRVKENISPFYLTAFINAKYGRFQLMRFASGGVQGHINLTILEELKIVMPSRQIEQAVEKLVLSAYQKKMLGENAYKNAEQMLLKEINLDGYSATDEGISVRSFSEVLAHNRFDAEYWQPDYDVIQNAIKKHKDGFDTLDNLFVIADKKVTIEPEKEYLYAELADVNGAMGTIDNLTVIQGKELPSRGRMSLKKDDIVMSSLDGSLSKIALVTSDEKNIIGSTGFFVLRKKEYEPEVALILLKSKPIQALLERQGQGTILSAIPKTSLSRVVLPKLNQTLQKKIKELVHIAHKEKEEAKFLLEKAKRAVEIFVEKDEKEALKYLG